MDAFGSPADGHGRLHERLGERRVAVDGAGGSVIREPDANDLEAHHARVRELKVDEQEYHRGLDAMAANALEDICTRSNPRLPSHDDLVSLLESAW